MGLWTKTAMHFLKLALFVATELYPEFLGKLFLINAPFIFSGIWTIIKGWLDEKIRRKIVMLGKNYYNTLAEYIDED